MSSNKVARQKHDKQLKYTQTIPNEIELPLEAFEPTTFGNEDRALPTEYTRAVQQAWVHIHIYTQYNTTHKTMFFYMLSL